MKAFMVVALMIACAAPCLAAPDAKSNRVDKPDRPRSFISEEQIVALQLTPDQRAELAKLQKNFARAQNAWMKAHRGERRELREQVAAARASGDDEKIKASMQAWRAHFGPLNDIRKEYRNKLRELLTDDQKTRLDDSAKKS